MVEPRGGALNSGKFPGTFFDVVAVASSAGGLQALHMLLGALPRGLPAAVLISQHLSPNRRSYFADLLNKAGGIEVRQAVDGEVVAPGVALIAPPDFHILLTPHFTLNLSHGDRVTFSRPSADVMLDSVAQVCGARALAVVLTGMGRDGTLGVKAIRLAGGVVIAQDPRSAEFAAMPTAAEQSGAVNFVLPLESIAPKILSLLDHGFLE